LDYKSYGSGKDQYGHNCKSALEIAESKLQIPTTIIDWQDLSSGAANEKQLVLYLSLLFSAYKERDQSMSKGALARKVKELEEQLRILKKENEELKAQTNDLANKVHNLEETLSLQQNKHLSLKTTTEETTSKLSSLQEEYNQSTLSWDQQIASLKSQMASQLDSSDAQTTELQNSWDKMTAQRDKVREELNNAKDEWKKEKESLEQENESLLSNLKRNAKMKEQLEEIMKAQKENHDKTILALRRHLLQHMSDLNVWKPYLEEDREYKAESVKLPSSESLETKEFSSQISTLDGVVLGENKRMEKLLKERELEAAEVVSVNMGKKKKRLKKEPTSFQVERKS